MTMLNRLRAALACLRGRPVIAHCEFYEDDEPVEKIRAAFNVRAKGETTRSAPIELGSVRGLTIIENTFTPR